MRFNSLAFVVFFAVILVLHNLRLSWRLRKFNLLWLSYVFYAAWNPPFVVLLWISTLVDWEVGKRLHRTEDPGRRRWLLLASLAANLGMLSYFKYGTFVVENFVALVGALGIDWSPAAPSIVLPIGISFYTFQTLSYTLDIHARRAEPAKSFLDYALFVTFFPQLVAGPIVRAVQFLPQCVKPPVVSRKQFAWGLYCLVIGLFEKVVIADGLLAPSVDAVFAEGISTTALDGWLAGMGFAAQVFCDFAGYSLCAIGVARCLGFNLPMNFNFPLASIGFAEFWRRWHISLSSWLRDYVYLSIGGSRVRIVHWAFNVVFTFTLVGLWHGAAWRFVLFGVISGIYIVLERAARSLAPRSALWSRVPVLFCFALIQFLGFSLSLLVFRSQTVGKLLEISTPIFTGTPVGRLMFLQPLDIALIAGLASVLFLWHWAMRASSLEQLADRCAWPLKAAALAFMLVSIVIMSGPGGAYIYFQF